MRFLPPIAWALVAVVLLAVGGRAAHAQATTRTQEELLETLDSDQLEHGNYSLDIGLGTILTSRLEAKATKIYPIVPYVSFRYDDLLAIDENEARLNILKPEGGLGTKGWRAGIMLKVDTGRPKFTSSNLQALPDVDPTLEVGGFVSYNVGPARIRMSVRGDATGRHGGAIVELTARSGFYQSGRLSLAAETGLTWVSQPYMRTFHGVTPAQALQTGLQPFAPGSGFHDADFSIMGQFQFAKHWSIIGVTQYSRLLGPAAASPITLRRRALDRANIGTFVVYTF